MQFLAVVRADSLVTLKTCAHEVAEPAKWLLKGGRNTDCFSDSQVVTRCSRFKSRASKAGRLTMQFNFYCN